MRNRAACAIAASTLCSTRRYAMAASALFSESPGRHHRLPATADDAASDAAAGTIHQMPACRAAAGWHTAPAHRPKARPAGRVLAAPARQRRWALKRFDLVPEVLGRHAAPAIHPPRVTPDPAPAMASAGSVGLTWAIIGGGWYSIQVGQTINVEPLVVSLEEVSHTPACSCERVDKAPSGQHGQQEPTSASSPPACGCLASPARPPKRGRRRLRLAQFVQRVLIFCLGAFAWSSVGADEQAAAIKVPPNIPTLTQVVLRYRARSPSGRQGATCTLTSSPRNTSARARGRAQQRLNGSAGSRPSRAGFSPSPGAAAIW